MSKLYLSAPLPFVGQKRMFAKHFIEVIKQYPAGTIFVDLFGGSGLLSHITKHFHPESRVIYMILTITDNASAIFPGRTGSYLRSGKSRSKFPGISLSLAKRGTASSSCLRRRNARMDISTLSHFHLLSCSR